MLENGYGLWYNPASFLGDVIVWASFTSPKQLFMKGSRQWQSAIDVAKPRLLVITAAFLNVQPAGPFARTCKRFPLWKTGGWFTKLCAQAASGRWRSLRNVPLSSQESRRPAVIFVLRYWVKGFVPVLPGDQALSGTALRSA